MRHGPLGSLPICRLPISLAIRCIWCAILLCIVHFSSRKWSFSYLEVF